MSFPRYPAYKDSGVEWLGEVPGHWDVISIKWLSPVRRGASPRPIDDPKYFDSEGEYAWVRIADVSACNGILTETTQQLSELGSSLSVKVAPGDLFVSIAGTVGKPCMSAIKACIHDGFVYFPTLQIDPKFLYRIFEGGTCYGGLGKWGTQLNLNTDTIGSIRIALPPKDELQLVLAFLDRETAKIDALVAEQRRLMALLKEKRQAVISHAVTRGLNPDAPMKPSGIEWLGDVPAHWDTRTIAKASTKITNGFVGPTRDILVEAGTPYIQATHIKNGRVNFDEGYFVRPDWSAAHLKSILCEGDVLIVQTGAGTGDVGLVSENEVGYNCHALIIVAPDQTLLHGTYLSAVLQSTYGQEKLTSIETGAMHPHLNCGEVKFVEIPLPPLAEQSAIVSYINRSADQIDNLTTEAQRAIDLLQERRTALISAAVTGQIDVRGAHIGAMT